MRRSHSKTDFRNDNQQTLDSKEFINGLSRPETSRFGVNKSKNILKLENEFVKTLKSIKKEIKQENRLKFLHPIDHLKNL